MAQTSSEAARGRGPAIRQARLARVRTIRRRVIAGALALFVATWLLIAVVLASGRDPALSAKTAVAAIAGSGTTATSSGQTSSEASDSSDTSDGSTGSAASSGSSSGGASASGVTTRQS